MNSSLYLAVKRYLDPCVPCRLQCGPDDSCAVNSSIDRIDRRTAFRDILQWIARKKAVDPDQCARALNPCRTCEKAGRTDPDDLFPGPCTGRKCPFKRVHERLKAFVREKSKLYTRGPDGGLRERENPDNGGRS